MASKDKAGIKYFSQDSDHVLNKKIKLLYLEFDSHGPWVYECLKCAAYSSKGYYFDISDQEELMIFASDVCKKPVSLVNEIIAGCVRRDLFDKGVFDMFKVLTSDRIQNNYLDGTREKRKKGHEVDLIKEYLLVEIGTNEKSINLISINGKFSRENFAFSREKLSKGDEIKGEEIKVEDEVFEKNVLKFFGFNEIANFDKLKQIAHFCHLLHFNSQLDFFKKQFENYRQFIELIGIRYRVNFNKFLGTVEESFTDGHWNAENWEEKLMAEKNKSPGPANAANIPDVPDNKLYAGFPIELKKLASEKWRAAGYWHKSDGTVSEMGWHDNKGKRL